MGCFVSKSSRTLDGLTIPEAAPSALPVASQPCVQPSIKRIERAVSLSLTQEPRLTPPARAHEAPEPRAGGQAFASMVRRVLGEPSTTYQAVVPARLRDSVAALIVLTDRHGTTGDALLAKARKVGWAECLAARDAALTHKRQGYGLGPLDGLLYRGAITANEYWTASTVAALLRDSQQPSITADESLRGMGEPVAFGGSYVDITAIQTFDLTVPTERGAALQNSYYLNSLTKMHHSKSVQEAAAHWSTSPERFMYRVPTALKGTYPWFGLAPFIGPITPWNLDRSHAHSIPVFSLSMFQHDMNFFHTAPLVAAPRLGVDSVAALQEQVLAGRRAAGMSHGFPWSDRSKHLHADFLPTGEAGFAWHDLGHLCVGSVDPPEARRVQVLLHRELSAHCKQLELPETIGRFPFRKLFVARLFGLTDQAESTFGLTVNAALQRHVSTHVGAALHELVLDTGAGARANVHTNFLAHLPEDHVFHAELDSMSRTTLAVHLAAPATWQEDPDVLRLGPTWNHFCGLQIDHSNRWLADQGRDVVATLSEPSELLALATRRESFRATGDTDAILYSGSLSFLRETVFPVYGGNRLLASLPFPLQDAEGLARFAWTKRGDQIR